MVITSVLAALTFQTAFVTHKPEVLNCRGRDDVIMTLHVASPVWTPHDGSEVLHCDAPGIEPVDITAADSIRDPVALYDARPVKVTVPAESVGTIEWREDSEAGTRLIASRPLPHGIEFSVPVANRDRLIRIVKTGSAPATYIVLKSTSSLRDSIVRPGGELYVRLSPKAFPPPIELRIDESQTTVLNSDAAHLIASELSPGIHKATPVYRAGLKGKTIHFSVQSGLTTELAPLILPANGGISLMAGLELCRGVSPVQLEIRRKDSVVARLPAGDCKWQVDGLPPASYVGQLVDMHTNHRIARGQFAIEAETRGTGTLQPFDIHVEGTVLRGQQPVQDTVIDFSSDAKETITATTDPSGRFSVDLPRAGNYEISLHSTMYVSSATLTRVFERDDSDAIFRFPSTEIDVAIRRENRDPSKPVVLSISGPTSFAGPVEEEDLSRIPLIGIPYGEYRVRASDGSATSDAVSVALSEDAPAARIELVLREQSGSLTIRDSNGNPVANATVTGGRQLKEVALGQYSLAGVPEGQRLEIVNARYLPQCVERRTGDMTTVMNTSGPFTAAIKISASDNPADGFLSGLPGSTCAVRISQLPITVHDQTLLVDHLPPGNYTYFLGRRRVSFQVPGSAAELR
jgi:hypothetical protein